MEHSSPVYSFKTHTIGLYNRTRYELKKNYDLYLLVLIPVVYLILFKYIPIYGVQIAFRSYSITGGILDSPWVGLKYVKRFLNSYHFWGIMRNTISISLYSLMTFPLPVVLAILLNYMPSIKFKKIVQTVSYSPYFISMVVMVGLILQFFDMRTGPINLIITMLGGKAVPFMMNPKLFYLIYIGTGVWQGIGYGAIIYISALAGVSQELHEAAVIDGASIIKRIRYIDIPCIIPTVTIMFILRCGTIMYVDYEKVFLMQNDLNLQVSEVISTYVYKQGLVAELPQYSYSSAIGLFVSLINCITLLIANRISKSLSGSSLW